MWTEGQRKSLKEEADENNEQFSNTDILSGGHSLSVLNRGTEGREEKCASGTGRTENGTKKGGKGRKRRRN